MIDDRGRWSGRTPERYTNMALSREEILNAIGELTVLDLAQLVKYFEEKFGVSAAPVAVAAAAPAAGGGAAAAEEAPTSFNVILTGAGAQLTSTCGLLGGKAACKLRQGGR